MKTVKWVCVMFLLGTPWLWAQDSGEGRGAWLGVKLGPVGEALSSHLNQEGESLLVLNVAKGSPADVAALMRHDVLSTYNGQPMPGDIREFASVIRGMKAGDPLKLSIFRKGTQRDVTVVLAGWPEGKAIEYKYEETPDEVYQDHFDVMGKILRRRPDGGWALEDLWDFEKMPEGLQGLFEQHLPDFGDIDIERFNWGDMPGARHHLKRFDFDDGKGIEILQKRGGKITVRKFESDGDLERRVEEKTYTNEEELKENDQEAYDLYKTMTKAQSKNHKLPAWQFDGRFLDRDRWRDRMSRMMDQAFRKEEDVAPKKAFKSFSVDEEGKIEVSIRDGEGEYKEVFKDAEDLKSRKPELYDELEKIRGGKDNPGEP
jgi:hypothetical protein